MHDLIKFYVISVRITIGEKRNLCDITIFMNKLQ